MSIAKDLPELSQPEPEGEVDELQIASTPVESTFKVVTRSFFDNKIGVIGLVMLVLLVLFSFVGPLIYHSDTTVATYAINLPPGPGHPLGTDGNGRDELGRLMLGGQSSLVIGVASAVLASILGTIWGALAGFFGGIIDSILMRVVDALLAVPAIFILLYLETIYRPTETLLVITISALGWMGVARLVRGETLSLREREFVKAVRVMGGSRSRIIFRHIIPNTFGVIVVATTLAVANSILILATLGFLGFGLAPPTADWGSMLSDGVNYIYDGYWWLIYPAGLLIVMAVLSFNFIGDGLRDALETRLQRR